MWYNAPGVANLLAARCGVRVVAPSSALGFPLLKAPSRSGRKIMDEIEGFREYLGVAEEDRLERAQPAGEDAGTVREVPALCGRARLPERLGAKFAGVLAAAGTARRPPTAWYVGSRDWSSDPVSFADHLGSDLSSTICVVVDRARLQQGGGGGSSGGGSSGGGGGGGGGGGW